MQDPLSDIIHAANISGGVFLDSSFTAPWAIYSQITPEDCASFLDIPAHLIAYHVVVEGSLYLEIQNATPIEVKAGEIILLPKNQKHILASQPGVTPVDADELIFPGSDNQIAKINYGGGGKPTKIYCGYLACEFIQNPLIETLPDFIKLDIAHDIAKDWIETSVQFAAIQLSRGPLIIRAKLGHIFFSEPVI